MRASGSFGLGRESCKVVGARWVGSAADANPEGIGRGAQLGKVHEAGMDRWEEDNRRAGVGDPWGLCSSRQVLGGPIEHLEGLENLAPLEVGRTEAGFWVVRDGHNHRGELNVSRNRTQNKHALFFPSRAALLHLVRALACIDHRRDKIEGRFSRGCTPCPAEDGPFRRVYRKAHLGHDRDPSPWAEEAFLGKPLVDY